MKTKALVLALALFVIGVGGKYYQTKAEANQEIEVNVLETVPSHDETDMEQFQVPVVTAGDWSEAEIMMQAIIDVKVHKKESVYLMEPEEMKEYASEVGATVNLGESLPAILYIESKFGTYGRVGDSGVARGVAQIQRPTARYILNKLMGYPNIEFSDDDIDKLLTKNDRVSIIMSKHYLVYLMDKFKDQEANWSRGLLSYNTGPGNVKKHGTSWDPNKYLKQAKTFIKRERNRS